MCVEYSKENLESSWSVLSAEDDDDLQSKSVLFIYREPRSFIFLLEVSRPITDRVSFLECSVDQSERLFALMWLAGSRRFRVRSCMIGRSRSIGFLWRKHALKKTTLVTHLEVFLSSVDGSEKTFALMWLADSKLF